MTMTAEKVQGFNPAQFLDSRLQVALDGLYASGDLSDGAGITRFGLTLLTSEL